MLETVPACAGFSPEFFFPTEDTPEGAAPSRHERWALAVCSRCPMVAECLAEALRFPGWEQYGVVGGTTAGQRLTLLRRRNPAAA